jgi:hypothetical protein
MLKVDLSASSEEVLNALGVWLNALDEEDYEKASKMLYWPPWSKGWSADIIKRLIVNYGAVDPRKDGQVFKVTDPNIAQGNPDNSVRRFSQTESGAVGDVCYDLPLNGEWSQVTATFRLYRIGDEMGFGLEDIHVL